MGNKKIVIIPTFCDSHLIRYQIDNLMETINPDYIVYNEGLFPRGPESNTLITKDFLEEYTLDGRRGFDFNELEEIININQKKYPQTNIILNKMEYPLNIVDAPQCATYACTNFKELGINIKEGDYIFPLEGDVFHHQDSKEEIEGYLNQLTPNSGFKSIWIDFMETQFYAEKKTLDPFINNIDKGGRRRKVCVRYGDMKFLKNVLSNFMTQQYPMLHPTPLITYHYPWWKPGKFKELRYNLINREKSYHKHFDNVLTQIRKHGKDTKDDIVLRPSLPESRLSRYVSHIEIDHPKHIKQHPNYI